MEINPYTRARCRVAVVFRGVKKRKIPTITVNEVAIRAPVEKKLKYINSENSISYGVTALLI